MEAYRCQGQGSGSGVTQSAGQSSGTFEGTFSYDVFKKRGSVLQEGHHRCVSHAADAGAMWHEDVRSTWSCKHSTDTTYAWSKGVAALNWGEPEVMHTV